MFIPFSIFAVQTTILIFMKNVDTSYLRTKTRWWQIRNSEPTETEEERKERLERLKEELEDARLEWDLKHPGQPTPKYLYDADVDDIDPDPYSDYRDDWKEMAEEGAQFSWMD